MIDRYGNEIEADLHERFGLDLVDFHRDHGDPRRLSRSKLAALVEILERHGTSYLTWAKSLDVDVYRAASAGGLVSGRAHRPHSFEMTEQTQINAALFSLIQQLIKVTARDKKYRPKEWPRPETAAEIVRREDADRGYDRLMDEVVHIPDDQYEEFVAKHAGEQMLIRHDLEQ